MLFKRERGRYTKRGYRLLALVTVAATMEFLPLVADVKSALSITVTERMLL